MENAMEWIGIETKKDVDALLVPGNVEWRPLAVVAADGPDWWGD